ncbi:hypothetical protein K469DRAFT_791692 [Zopfia rhizophila CBS 207.26]|uniref:Uncharacterized protein n=1 Tax=Zopfia rhizophila CBS 207.26 TaxID=1314779 RepID=A0A6A6DU17_9PEZI|nr:hypothetical protein K469DRAFT_791692 [Zopfia rhizophila CBS 207.26]
MSRASSATIPEKVLFAPMGFIAAIAAVWAPVLFLIAHPGGLPLTYGVIEQIVVNLFKYYDFSDSTLNTKFPAPTYTDQELRGVDEPSASLPLTAVFETDRYQWSRL